MADTLLHGELTREIIGAFYDVRYSLPWGMQEQVYAKALTMALRARGVPYVEEVAVDTYFRGERVGQFRVDLVVDQKVIVELKSVERLTGAFEAQLINYLAASGLSVGLLLNFGLHGDRRRIVWTPHVQRLQSFGSGGPTEDVVSSPRAPRSGAPHHG